jgi:predicted transcriptional regulator
MTSRVSIAPSSSTQSIVELVKDLTIALIEKRDISPEDMQDTLQRTYATLTALKVQEERGVFDPEPVSASSVGDWRKSITKHTVTCLECNLAFKQLSIRHLRMHGLDGHSYRAKYGIPRTQPLAARDTTARRRQVVQETRPWEQAATYRKGQAQNGHQSSEPEAETVPEETNTSSAEVPAQPKRQRKTSPKKTARKTRSER